MGCSSASSKFFGDDAPAGDGRATEKRERAKSELGRIC